MNKIVLILLVLAAVFFYMRKQFTVPPPPPLPSSLLAIACQQNSDHIAPNGYDVFQAGDTTLFSPCTKPGTAKRLAKEAVFFKGEGEMGSFSFKIANDGVGTVAITDDMTSVSPRRAETQYTVNATWSLKEAPEWDASIAGQPQLEIATPSAFAAGGPSTIFYCKQLYSLIEECWGRARSTSLFWIIHITYGRPYAAIMPQGQITRALQLVADHIFQAPGKENKTASAAKKPGNKDKTASTVVLREEIDAATLERYEAADAERKNAASPQSYEDTSVLDRVRWSGTMMPIPFDKNPYSITLAVTGHARAAGVARSLWKAGWSVDDGYYSMLSAGTHLLSKPLSEGEAFTMEIEPITQTFKEGIRAKAQVEFMASDNMVIDKVEVRVSASK